MEPMFSGNKVRSTDKSPPHSPRTGIPRTCGWRPESQPVVWIPAVLVALVEGAASAEASEGQGLACPHTEGPVAPWQETFSKNHG